MSHTWGVGIVRRGEKDEAYAFWLKLPSYSVEPWVHMDCIGWIQRVLVWDGWCGFRVIRIPIGEPICSGIEAANR